MPTVYAAGATVYFKYTSKDSGVPFTLAGSPVVSIYKDDSTTQSVAGVTLAVDFDGVTGLNHISVDTSADGSFYANAHSFIAVITTGTVNGTSVVGEVIGSFDLAAAGTVDANVVSVANDAISAAGISAAAVTKIQAGLSTYAGGTVDTNLISVNGTTFAGVNVPAILADGVTHGGATTGLSLQQWSVDNGSNGAALILNGAPAFSLATTVGSTVSIDSQGVPVSSNVVVITPGNGSSVHQRQQVQIINATAGAYYLTFDDNPSGGNPQTTAAIAWDADNAAIALALEALSNWPGGTVSGSIFARNITFDTFIDYHLVTINTSLLIGSPAASVVINNGLGNLIDLITNNGHGINVLAAGTGKKALLLAGDAATDSLAIAAGSGSPIDVFDGAGRLLLQPTQTGVTIPTVTTLTNLPAITADWLTGTGVAASAVTKVQAGLATPTNITAGTITNVTNLTNAPTSGDLTAAMKASVTTAATAATPTAASVTNKTGYSLAAAGLDAVVIEAGLNARQSLSIIAAALAGADTGLDTGTIVIKGAGVNTTRITATGDASGNRSAITLFPPA